MFIKYICETVVSELTIGEVFGITDDRYVLNTILEALKSSGQLSSDALVDSESESISQGSESDSDGKSINICMISLLF